MALQAITANRLRDGVVVWRAKDGAWVERLEDAAAFEPADAEQELAAARLDERENRIVGLYAFDVVVENGLPVPVKIRERLRGLGPSVRTDLGKQAPPPAAA
ncbi:hypothetical protein M2352_001429 [Azospirillum fermentarium]|uniref:DUF2849 domain-containing protein n=1 Tax=Azospirillum fermentarium TaxID=1233114 RepID=UPI00222784F1|nr:DUF2849 domain-containing protein [Azospirillum fermentarium]MCW2245838.1 hypothetical protein [Azospirillum fermentarium]